MAKGETNLETKCLSTQTFVNAYQRLHPYKFTNTVMFIYITIEFGPAFPVVCSHASKEVPLLVPDHQEGGAFICDVSHQLGEAVSIHWITKQESPLCLVHAGQIIVQIQDRVVVEDTQNCLITVPLKQRDRNHGRDVFHNLIHLKW